jgi:putative transposase
VDLRDLRFCYGNRQADPDDNLAILRDELIRQEGISEQTLCRWKKQYKGLETDQVRQLEQLQEENGRLKRLLADLTLDKTMLQDVLSRKF